jgi:hypothetical protein
MESVGKDIAMSVSRETLYEEVRAEPLLKVAARHNVSSSFLTRVCRRMNVPCPPRGYWIRKPDGLRSKVPPLPSPEPGDELAWVRDGGAVPRQPYPSPSTQKVRGAKGVPAQTDETGRHVHLIGIETLFENATVMSNDYLRPSKRLLADLYATKKSLPQVIEAASKLYLHLEGKGYRVGFCPVGIYFHRPGLAYCEGKSADSTSYYGLHPARPTLVYFGTMPIGLTVFEQSEEVEAQLRGGKWVRVSDIPPPSGRRRGYEPTYYTSTHEFKTGRVAVRAYSPYKAVPWERTWVEAEVGGFEAMLDQIAGVLKAQASRLVPLVHEAEEKERIEHERRVAEQEAWRRRRAIEEEQERLAKIERARLKAIQDSKNELLDLMKRWDQAQRVQAFLSGIERLVEEAPLEEQAMLWERLEQARDFLGSIDLPALFKKWRTPAEFQGGASRPATEPDVAHGSPAQERAEAELRNEVDLWKRRYIYGRM